MLRKKPWKQGIRNLANPKNKNRRQKRRNFKLKTLFKLPSSNIKDLIYPSKHAIILEWQKILQDYFKDKRQVNRVFNHTNRFGEQFIYGEYGHGKNGFIFKIGEYQGPNHILIEKHA